MDETWVHCYDPELKRQSAEWRGSDKQRPTKFRQEPSALMQMMIFPYISERVIIAYRVPPRATVNKKYYSDFIRRLRHALNRKQPDILRAGPLLLHDNATCHTAETVRDRLAAYDWEILPHPPYSPDLSPPDFDLFPVLKETLRGKRYADLDELAVAVTARIRQIEEQGLCRGIEKLPQRWEATIQKLWDYIEH